MRGLETGLIVTIVGYKRYEVSAVLADSRGGNWLLGSDAMRRNERLTPLGRVAILSNCLKAFLQDRGAYRSLTIG